LRAWFSGSKLAAVLENALEKPLLVDKQQASKLEVEFAEILEPFEAGAGASLKGWGRQKCFAAFAAHPRGFQVCMSEALERGRNPIALLVQMVKDGDHAEPLKTQTPKLESAPEPPRGRGTCHNCGREDDVLRIDGCWWCSGCEGLAPR